MTTSPGDSAAQYQTRSYEQAQALPVPAEHAYPAPPPPQAYGQPMAYHQVQPHSAALGVVASFFIPGLGSMLNEKVGKGLAILGCYLLGIILVFFIVGFFVMFGVWIWGMVAANNDAHAWNRAHGILS